MEFTTPERENSLRDDIKPRTAQGFNTRDSKVRMHSIGWLDDNYISRRNILHTPFLSDTYTRIPPISTLPILFEGNNLKNGLIKRLSTLGIAMLAGASAMYGWVRLKTVDAGEVVVSHLPKSYSASRGVHIDWPGIRQRLLRAATPLLLLIFMITAIMLFNNNSLKTRPNNHGSLQGSTGSFNSNRPVYISPTANQSNGSSASSNGAAGANTNNESSSAPGYYLGPSEDSDSSSSTSSASSASSGAAASSASSPSSSSSTGSTSSTSGNSSSGSGSTGSILPITVTVPPVNTSLDGKTLLDTSSTSITIN